ncbi:hypothetical protein MKX01_014358 [Papaver californicum]|nr:hypothetical protein MKX01_014358 [Papaver californicum]
MAFFKTLFVSVLLTVLSTCLFVEIDGRSRSRSLLSEQREFDYFALSLQWPGTICQHTRHCCAGNGCCTSDNGPTEFTIHGLWPDYNDGTWPACCTQTRFDEKLISSLRKDLDKYWPSLSCGKPSTCSGGRGVFWAHEWEKHGTCSSPVVHDEYQYFTTTLSVYFKYNVTAILAAEGYVPSNSEKYPLGGIVSAVQNAFGATPQLVCSHGAIEELRLCFYKDFKPRDCIMNEKHRSCPNYVSMPERRPMGHESALPWSLDGEVFSS